MQRINVKDLDASRLIKVIEDAANSIRAKEFMGQEFLIGIFKEDGQSDIKVILNITNDKWENFEEDEHTSIIGLGIGKGDDQPTIKGQSE